MFFCFEYVCESLTHYFPWQVQKGERQKLMRQMDRRARRQQHLEAQRVGRTPAGIAMDSEAMMMDVLNFSKFTTPADRIFIAFATPLPCYHCEQLRNIAEGLTMSCECQFYHLRPDSGRFHARRRPCCPTCNKVRYQDGKFILCPCVELCRQQCVAAGLWR